MRLSYQHTRYACYAGYITQAIINNLAPLLFIIFQTSYGLNFEMVGRLILINFGTQILADLIAVKFADTFGYRASAVAAHAFSAAGLVLLGILPEARPLLLLCFFYLFFSLIIRIRSHRIRTAVTFTLWSLSVILLVHIPPVAAAGVGIAAVVLYKHRRPDGEGSPVRKRLRLRKKAS